MKGYEYDKGKFVVLKDEDFKRVDLEAAAQTIDIIDFVPVEEINPMFMPVAYALWLVHVLRDGQEPVPPRGRALNWNATGGHRPPLH